MRHALVLALILCAPAAYAGPLDFFTGVPDAPGVVRGGSFGPNGNDYYGDMRLGGSSRTALTARHARVKLQPAAREKRLPRS
ncbi:hypothetical protein [Methylobacterium sp.]|jgi:hypothetical protein|uniref:hypothetical protein n=1 Tax=Methylobacterium sp. TaxID=409 RepID=UPI0025E593C3|nr:hypothetical protein [Methylobacterium sp.]MBY0259828.1 hypothetical protein [Methylobacterium sp.]